MVSSSHHLCPQKLSHAPRLLIGIAVACIMVAGGVYYLLFNHIGSLDGISERAADAAPLPAAVRSGPWQGPIHYAKRSCLLCDPEYLVAGRAVKSDVEKWAAQLGLSPFQMWEDPLELSTFIKSASISADAFSFPDERPYLCGAGTTISGTGYVRMWYAPGEQRLIVRVSTRAD